MLQMAIRIFNSPYTSHLPSNELYLWSGTHPTPLVMYLWSGTALGQVTSALAVVADNILLCVVAFGWPTSQSVSSAI